jgi:hypothetical protein
MSNPHPAINSAVRDLWRKALDDVLAFADELKGKTDPAFIFGDRGSAKWAIMVIGLRVRRNLQAVRVLVPYEWDDVIGNLSRFLVEAAIDVIYLQTTSTWGTGARAPTLTPDMKGGLFATQVFLLEKKVRGSVRPANKPFYEAALATRAALHLKPGNTWHCRRTSEILEKLQAETTGRDQVQVDVIKKAFLLNSYFVHNNPNVNFYVEADAEGNAELSETCAVYFPLQSAVMSGVEVCYRWGLALGLEERECRAKLEVAGALKTDPRTLGDDTPS